MDYSQAASEFKVLKAQYDAGALSEADFKARLQDLMVQDEQGRWWMIGYETGQWYVHDGEKWVRGEPPMLHAKPSVSRIWIVAGMVALVIIASVISWFAGKGQTARTPTLAPTTTPTLIPPTSAPTPTLAPGATRVSEFGILVYVPAGEFLMGSPQDEGDPDEHPQPSVSLDDYWIMSTEVTNAEYGRCVDAGACEPPADGNRRYLDAGSAKLPVTGVTWDQAHAYAKWAGGRLPTEAEWEKACRGTDGRTYPWGNQGPTRDLLNYSGTGLSAPNTVGSYPKGASPYGALDMAGNVMEWTADWYDWKYYANSPHRNPTGPATGAVRVLRGGSFSSSAYSLRCAYRYRDNPDFKGGNLGFRVVVSPGS